MAEAAGRTLLLGLELGDGRLVRDWAGAGHLPHIARLIERGSWRWLETTADRLHVSAWPSIYTGTSPGQHGVYYTFQPAPGEQGHKRFYEGLYGRPTFWRLLDEAGKRCVVLDAPYSHLEEGYGGAQIVDWGSWAHYLASHSRPKDLLSRLERACGRYPLGLEAHDIGFMQLDPKETSDRLVRAVAAKMSAIDWLLGEEPSDMLFAVMGETHVASHYCWLPDAGMPDGTGNAQPLMRGVYEEIDRGVGRLVERIGPDATIAIVSGDAVGPNRAGWHLLPEMLGRLGWFAAAGQAPKQSDPAASEAQPQASSRFDPVKALRDLLPKDLRKAIARKLPTKLRDALAKRVDTADIDWSRTKAFCLPTDLEGCIRINLEGREPEGIVKPADYERVRDEVAAAMRELTDPATGRKLVREVILADDAFPGPRRQHLPDIIILWDASAPITALASPGAGTVESASPDTRPGTHAAPGFALLSGPGVPSGQTLNDGHIYDLAPTMLARMGVEPPAHMEGSAWPEIEPRVDRGARGRHA